MAPSGIRSEPPLIVIVGPTASGKTGLAIELAEKFKGEIICADSRTVYKEMDIGTAKPTADEQARVPHWGIDLVGPDERFTAADFKSYADQKIREIRARGHVPFLVGGTGLYVDGVIFDYQFGDAADEERRQYLEAMSLGELYIYCAEHNIDLPVNYKNKRHVIRAIEQKGINIKRKMNILQNCYVVGIATERNILRTRIEHRIEQLFENGVVDEAKRLGKKYGWSHESMTGNIYRLCREIVEDGLSFADIKPKSLTLDWRLAKRQITWFKRNPSIEWLDLSDAYHYIARLLASEH